MNRKASRQLLKKYLDDSCTTEERRIVDQWYELLDNGYTTLSSGELKEIEDRLWEKVQLSTFNVTGQTHHKKANFIRWRYSMAASILGMLLIGLLWFYNKKGHSNPFIGFFKIL